jgi:hypothetical protein
MLVREKYIELKDYADISDYASLDGHKKSMINKRLSAGPVKTKIIITDNYGNTTEHENKVVISGAQFNACKAFGLDQLVDFPTYNDDMRLDNTETRDPKNNPVVSLFCVADSGCGSTPKDVKVTTFIDRLIPPPVEPTDVSEFTPEMIMPFRYVDPDDDLDDELRKYYFGRKTFNALGKIGYYFKTFDSEPQLHIQYTDGTPVTPDVYNVESDQSAECYVEMRLKITRQDLRDYFENALGWDHARISSLSLCSAWYDDEIDQYKWYQDIIPYTLLNFSARPLVDDTVAISIIYQIYY